MISQIAILLSALLCLPVLSQTDQIASRGSNSPLATMISVRGLNHKRIENISSITNELGERFVSTNLYWQLEPGLHFTNEKGDLEESKAIFDSTPGWAVANRMQHKVRLAANINIEGHVDVLLPDGSQIISQVSGLRFRDTTTGKVVLLSGVKNSQAYIVGGNQVVYADAFEKLSADVRYTITTFSFEQDILLHETPPSPEQFGLNPETTRLEVLTEFLKGPAIKSLGSDNRPPARVLQTGEDLSQIEREDLHFDLGTMRFGDGRAFSINVEGASPIPVAKSWIEADGRSFLVESIDLRSAGEQLKLLPNKSGGAFLERKGGKSRILMEARAAKLPARRTVGRAKPLGRVPRATEGVNRRLQEPLFALDYNSSLSGGTFTNFTFQADQTYYVSGDCTLTGTTTFEGGTVIKYYSFPIDWSQSQQANLWIAGPINCNTSIYKPAVFTGRDDDSVGATIASSTHYMGSTLYGPRAIAFWGYTNPIELHDMRFINMIKGICFDYCSDKRLRNIQFVNRGTAFSAGVEYYGKNGTVPPTTPAYLGNVMFKGLGTALYGAASSGLPAIGDLLFEHCSFKGNVYNVQMRPWLGYAAITMRNSIVGPCDSSVTAYDATSASNRSSEITNVSSAFFDNSSDLASILYSSIGGDLYLKTTAPYFNAGNTGIDAALVSDFRQMTTVAPMQISGAIPDGTVFYPIAPRDIDVPDLGYHYPAVDFITDYTTSLSSATLYLTNGVALGWYGSTGLTLQTGAMFVSQGTPVTLNCILNYTLFQENTSGSNPVSLFSTPTNSFPEASLLLRFTEINCLGGALNTILPPSSSSGDAVWSNISIQDSQFTGVKVQYIPVLTYGSTVRLANNLFNRSVVSLSDGSSWNANLTVNAWNNSFFGGSVGLTYHAGQPNWSITDNIFDGTSVSTFNTIVGTIDYNAFPGASPVGGGTHNTTNSVAYATGSLGNWYQSSTNYYNIGSRTGGAAGLYHYTTRTGQQKQLNSNVDIGFHYVATTGSGSAVTAYDYDSDGVPDYLEDANGDGSASSGETDWTIFGDLGIRVLITTPRSGSNVF